MYERRRVLGGWGKRDLKCAVVRGTSFDSKRVLTSSFCVCVCGGGGEFKTAAIVLKGTSSSSLTCINVVNL